MLHLDELTLRNFRCFAECEVNLHRKLTVLVAENGRGKTAILDAIRMTLGLLVDAIADTKQYQDFDGRNVRLQLNSDGAMTPVLPIEIIADGLVEAELFRCNWPPKKQTRTRSPQGTEAVRTIPSIGQGIRDRLKSYDVKGPDQPSTLPSAVFFGTGRFAIEPPQKGKRVTARPPRLYDDPKLDRLRGYFGCLSPSTSLASFVARYYGRVKALKLVTALAYRPDDRPEKLLSAVREAVKIVLEPTGWKELDWSHELEELVVEHADGSKLPLSVLSDGIRSMIALVGDIALRCGELNPHLGESAARLTPGILLIDEVDMHLHPGWQQLVVDLLQKAFPAMQMIVSTHSPHVLSTVDVESIRVIRLRDSQGSLETPKFQTRGVESADVLAAIMGVDPVPQVEEARLLSRYRSLIEDGKAETPDALALRAMLVDHFTAQHPLILDCDRLIRFQAFKLRRAVGEG